MKIPKISAEGKVYLLFFFGCILIAWGVFTCFLGLHAMGLSWVFLRGLLKFGAGIIIVVWGLRIMNKKV